MIILKLIFLIPEPIRYYLLWATKYLQYLIFSKHIKARTILTFRQRYGLNTLIETGTYLGETIELIKNNFSKVYSIELSRDLYLRVKKIFKTNKKINFFLGDSSKVLSKITKQIKKPCLFWLDAHYSYGITARGSVNTPVLSELKIISQRKTKDIILIDDAREFTGKNEYPRFQDLKTFILNNFKNYKIDIENDIIQIYPNE